MRATKVTVSLDSIISIGWCWITLIETDLITRPIEESMNFSMINHLLSSLCLQLMKIMESDWGGDRHLGIFTLFFLRSLPFETVGMWLGSRIFITLNQWFSTVKINSSKQ